jgi:hypothetical protein
VLLYLFVLLGPLSMSFRAQMGLFIGKTLRSFRLNGQGVGNGWSELAAGLAGLSRRLVLARADRDLVFQDSHVVSGWGFAPAVPFRC